MSRALPAGGEDSLGRARSLQRIIASGFIAFILLQPAFHLVTKPVTGVGWYQLAAALVLAGLVCWRVAAMDLDAQPISWPSLLLVLALGMSLFAIGGLNWLASLTVSAAVCGRCIRTRRLTVAGVAACAVTGLVVAAVHRYQPGELLSATAIAPLAWLFGYSVARRADANRMLRRTRAELARAAVAEERLRIARDLHDLLGHSLSLISLKAELAGRVIGSDPGRAATEISELQQVARQSLADVRAAVAGFRQPDLAAELVAARQLLDAAGITSRISAPDTPTLGQHADATLAWAVREGTTNVVRHSGASHVDITVTAGTDVAVAEITDNGPPADELVPVPAGQRELLAGPPGRQQAAAAGGTAERPGTGLAGLAERVRDLGGELAAGAVRPHGFRLRVVVPVGLRTS